MQDYKTIRSVEEIDAYLGNATVVAFDFETAATDEYRDEEWSALDAHKSEIAGISVCKASISCGIAAYHIASAIFHCYIFLLKSKKWHTFLRL